MRNVIELCGTITPDIRKRSTGLAGLKHCLTGIRREESRISPGAKVQLLRLTEDPEQRWSREYTSGTGSPLCYNSIMQIAALLTVLLAVECGYQWKVRRDPGLTVSEYEVATGGEDGIRYRTEVAGVNYCCSVHLDVLNVGVESVSVRPYAAGLKAEKCPVKFLSIVYVQGGDTGDFTQVDKHIEAKSMASHWPEKPLWQELQDPTKQFELAPNSFLTLHYFARGYFRKECGAYSFKLPVGSVTIATTFTEPK